MNRQTMHGPAVRRIRWAVIFFVPTLLALALPAQAVAATNGSLYLSPSTRTVAVGGEVDVQVRMITGTHTVNAVQANFTYPTKQLKVLGFDNTASAFGITAAQNNGNGIVQVARGSITPVSGDVNVTTVRFQTIGPGTADVCPQEQSMGVDSVTNQAIPWTMTGATYIVGTASTFGVGCLTHNWISQGASHSISIRGRGFSAAGATVAVSGTGVTTAKTQVVSSGQLTTNLTVATTAATGFRDVTVTSGGKSYVCASCLTIGQGPKVTSTTPTAVTHGVTGQPVAVHGQFLGRQTTVSITGMTVTTQHWVNYQEIDVTVSVPSTTMVGAKKVSLYDPYSESYGYYGRGSCSTCLSVN